ncbi:MAG: hypothetical protein ACE5FU_13220, partial [Nitrospinota bacterium]
MKKQNLAISGIGTFPVLLLLFSVFLHPAAYAADVPHTFSNGTAANADEVNANFKNLSDRSW